MSTLFGKAGPLASFSVLLAVVLLAGCGGGEPVSRFAGDTMGTTYHVTVVSPGRAVDDDLGEAIQAALDDVDARMSTYKADSELNRLNRNPVGEGMAVSAQLMAVLALSREIYEDTGGAFDPSVGPLVDLWGFGPGGQGERVPDDAEIRELVATEGFDSLDLDPDSLTVTKGKTVSLDLSAVAKGYGADSVAALLDARGIERYMVEVGGEMVLAGLNARDEPWQIAIERPVPEGRVVQRIVPVTDAAIATSGDYRNYFERDGKRYSHTIDPRTGYPVDHNLASVTVIADTGARADALATAFMVMGTEPALRYAEQRGIAILTLSKEGDRFTEAWSPAFEPHIGDGS